MLHVFHRIRQLKIIPVFQNGFNLLSISEGSKTSMSSPTMPSPKLNHFPWFSGQCGAHTPVFVNIFSSLCSIEPKGELKGYFKTPTLGKFQKGACHNNGYFKRKQLYMALPAAVPIKGGNCKHRDFYN